MKKEDLQNSPDRTNSAVNENENKIHQKNISNPQQHHLVHKTGLGRERITEEDFESDNDDLKNEDLNASNDQ